MPVDVGITGRDLMLDSGADAVEHLGLGFGPWAFRVAGPVRTMTDGRDSPGRRVASSYRASGGHLAERASSAEIVRLDGAVGSAMRLGVADAIADVVETGSTLRQADLEVFGEPILSSEAVMITSDAPEPAASRCSSAGSTASSSPARTS